MNLLSNLPYNFVASFWPNAVLHVLIGHQMLGRMLDGANEQVNLPKEGPIFGRE
jgi:hypothetical protein